MNQETRELITQWSSRAANEADPFVKFFIYYMCLDAWMTSESGHDSDSQKKKWLIEIDNTLRQHWSDIPENEKPLLRLTQIEKVGDMRPKHRGNYKHLKDVNNLKQVVDFIYQVRCNLFHGGKSSVKIHDQELVELSSAILKHWIERILTMTETAMLHQG
jgi:hypothetical protein